MGDKIHNPEKANQPILFDGMIRRSGLSPTDIDAFVEYNGRVFIYFEGKNTGKDLPLGQKMAFQHICDSYHVLSTHQDYPNRYFAWIFVFEHDVPENMAIMLKDQYLSKVYSSINPQWLPPSSDDVVPKFTLDGNGRINMLDAQIEIEKWCHENNIPID